MTQQYGSQTQQQPGQTASTSPTGGSTGGLPPTGLQQQLAAIQARNAQVMGMGGGVGFSPQMQQYGMAQSMGPGGQALPSPGAQGSNSLQNLANKLASSYGLSVGRGNLFDESGNPLQTPEQIAMASGGAETMGTAAAKMQYIADAIAKQQTMEAQEKGIDTLSAGIGLVQSRARGSAAALQSGLYQQMAAQYANQEYEAADFGYFIQREQQLIEQEMQRKAEKQAKKTAIGGVVSGVIGLAAAPFTGGMTLGIAAQGLGQIGSTGWI
jgi:hypothetical protein